MKTSTRNRVETPKMYETENDIPEQRRVELNALMSQQLANAIDLQTQMKQAHWNVKGPHFIGHTNCSIRLMRPWRVMWI